MNLIRETGTLTLSGIQPDCVLVDARGSTVPPSDYADVNGIGIQRVYVRANGQKIAVPSTLLPQWFSEDDSLYPSRPPRCLDGCIGYWHPVEYADRYGVSLHGRGMDAQELDDEVRFAFMRRVK